MSHQYLKYDPRAETIVHWRIFLVIAAVAFVALSFVSDPYTLDTVTQILMFASLATAWNIFGGMAGRFSLGHTAFFGVGAYTSTLSLVHFNMTPWISMWGGAVIAALVGYFLSRITLRLRGPFFTLSTIAFAEVMRIIAVNWRGLTRGSSGLVVLSPPGAYWFNFLDKKHYAWVALGLLALTVGVSYITDRSLLGYQLRALRENEDAAASLGIDARAVLAKAASLSAALTAMCGTFYAHYILYIEPAVVFGFDISLQPAIISIIGGMYSLMGPLVGSVLLVPLGQWLRVQFGGSLAGLHLFAYGIVLVVVVLLMPDGFLPGVRSAIRRWRTRKSEALTDRPQAH